jgi:nucleoside-diphosphate-sugar epimerase
MRVFLTGGSGFIGRHLIPLLSESGHEVLALSRKSVADVASLGVKALVGDLADPESYRSLLKAFKPDCAVHLAWEGLPDYSVKNCRRNLLTGLDLFEALHEAECARIFSTGTCWEYGKLTGPVKESAVGRERGAFAAFKVALRVIGESTFLKEGKNFIWGRPFFVYGPGQRSSALIPSCYRSLCAGESPQIREPYAVNDFIHVNDVARAIRALIEVCPATSAFNIGTGVPSPVWRVVNYVAESLGKPPVYSEATCSNNDGFWADTEKMSSLGWAPSLSLDAGIAQTVEALKACRR